MARKNKNVTEEQPIAISYTTDGQPLEIYEDKKLTALKKIVEQNKKIIKLLENLQGKCTGGY